MKNHLSHLLTSFSPYFLLITLLLAPFSSLEVSAKGPKGDAVAYPIKGEYHKLIVSSAFDVSFSDNVKEAMVTVPERFQKQVVVELDKGVLRIAVRGKVKFKKRPTIVLPLNKKLIDIELSGAATLTTGKLECEEMAIYLTGAAKFRGDIVAKVVHIEQAGASDYRGHLSVENLFLNLSAASTMEIRGRAFFKMEVKMIEASSLDAEKFEARRIEGSLDGASNAVFWCTERMVVPVRNASHLIYIGRPLVVNCPTSDVSTVTHK